MNFRRHGSNARGADGAVSSCRSTFGICVWPQRSSGMDSKASDSGLHRRTVGLGAGDGDAVPYRSDYLRRWKWDHDHRQRNSPTYTVGQHQPRHAPWPDRSPSVGCTSGSAHGMRIHPGAAWPKLANLDHGRNIGHRRFGRIHQTTSLHPITGLISTWGKSIGSSGGVAWHSPSRQ